MLLWAKPKKEDIKEIILKGLNILNVLKNFGPELEAKYVRRKIPNTVTKFKLTEDDFKTIIMDNINKEGNKEFINLGYTLHFFTDLDKKKLTAIYLHIGASFHKIVNSLIIHFSENFNIYKPPLSYAIIDLFKKLIILFQPFWACIANNINKLRFHKFVKDNKPTTVHWLNYWGSKLLENINTNNLQNAPVKEYEQINDGLFIKLKDQPIDNTNEEDISMQQVANVFFGL